MIKESMGNTHKQADLLECLSINGGGHGSAEDLRGGFYICFKIHFWSMFSKQKVKISAATKTDYQWIEYKGEWIYEN